MKRVLLLAGTAEARELATQLSKTPGIEAIASLAGATQRPETIALETRIGGFGGPDAMADWISEHRIDAVLDATHPFANQISQNAALAARKREISCLHVVRPAWAVETGDRWKMVPDMDSAAQALHPDQRVFLATGRTSLRAFKAREDCWFLARVISGQDADFPFKNGEFTEGRPPFSVKDEEAVLQNARIDVLVTKNAGGENSRSKLIAARNLQIPVIMIERPKLSEGQTVETIAQAMTWLKEQCDG